MSDYRLSDRYLGTEGTVLLTGVQALARLPIEQLRRDQGASLRTAAFLSGYPGSPLGGLDIEIERARKLVPDLAIVHQPAVNEELAATSVMGSQLAAGRPDANYEGVVGFWYGKAPGLDRAGDALRHGVFAGASSTGGAVVLVGDDPASKSSTMPSSSDATLVDLHMPILYPGTVAECLELGLHAVAMSRASGLWSAMKIVTPIADGSATVALPALGSDPVIPTVEVDGTRWQCSPSAQFLGPRMLAVEQEFREIRLPIAHRYGVENRLNRVTVNPDDAWIGLVATGFTYYEMLDALRRLGLDGERAISNAGIRLLQLRMPVPFDADLVRDFASGLDEIIVIEEKNATLESLIKDALYRSGDQPLVVGKTHEDGRTLMRSWGRLDADAMLDGLRQRLAVRLESQLAVLAPKPAERELIALTVNRTPYFCSGCPHNWGTKVPDDALVGAGTGCHGMTLLMDPERVGDGIGITAMGNEGAQWIGMEPFVAAEHLFQNYGDGTFFHSAQLALQYCIGAGKNITFKILYNGTVAMTGGQDATFSVAVPELVTILLAQGVAKVAITTEDVDRYKRVDLPNEVEVHDRTEIVAVQEDLGNIPGVTVLIHDQFCAAELRRARRRSKLKMPTRRVVINHRICEGCGDCGDVSNCLSVQPVATLLGRKTTIDQASCNFDYSCIEGDCPAFMTVESPNPRTRRPEDGTSVGEAVPEPSSNERLEARSGRYVKIRMAGIGGTGVVTVAQILATAAMLDGWDVTGLDQTGLSQKAGPVISDITLVEKGRNSSNLVG
ncbi:MAG: indolepyruvate ferredoxin oxidoreductase family protein, partial [Acidimicrobiales bacterium]